MDFWKVSAGRGLRYYLYLNFGFRSRRYLAFPSYDFKSLFGAQTWKSPFDIRM
ncbi:hypothetical protein B9Z19DRAFT_1086785 [Tuber borchii]|uniref:Uncharacterized protein n=1 Tax=Tuber borchii TaxID=42251 RepID=A0A2T6ZNS8_TUBBO|nr:hypothetical protein B9Z19DRAFT_1086785 [Tuber borchii]